MYAGNVQVVFLLLFRENFNYVESSLWDYNNNSFREELKYLLESA
jgi:hypothetical protein